MREEVFYELIREQDDKNRQKYKDNLRQLVQDEFVMNNIFLRYLDYMEQCIHSNVTININEVVQKIEAPTKKVKDFDISRHDVASVMYLHKHNYIELDYVYRGSCKYYINNENNVFHLNEKQLCIVNQNVVHGIEASGADDIIIKCMIPFSYIDLEHFVEINQDTAMKKFLMHAVNENVTKASYIVFDIINTEGLEDLIYQLFGEFVKQNSGWRQAVKSYLNVLMMYLMRQEACEIRTAKEMEEDNLNITKVLDCIRKNYQYITLKDIAKDLHFHENYLSRMIKQQTKKNFRELLSECRLKEAENLLKYTELSVTEIAMKVGYQKSNFFYQTFKQHYGMTPAEYRAEK